MPLAPRHRCWICGSPRLTVVRSSRIDGDLDSEAFAITDRNYGRTGEVHRCDYCSFLQCSELVELVAYYEELEDATYEATRPARGLQMQRLLRRVNRVAPPPPGARLLDVGAGSGILVEQARRLGYKAVGIEPSRWLHERAVERGLAVEKGTLPHPALPGPFDVVTLIDVIEHVPDPVRILRDIGRVLAPEGVVAVVTPDVSAIAPRLMGWRWWHFRLAHVGYFNRATLDLAFARAGLEMFHLSRPSWVLDLAYAITRVNAYIPEPFQLPVPELARRIHLPLNLWDVLFALARPVRTAR